MTPTPAQRAVAVTINPSLDQTVAIPRFTAGAVNRVTDSQITVGGKGNNVAGFLADYGLEMTVTGFLGRANASLFQAYFAQKGITDRFIRIPGETRTCLKICDAELQQTTDVNFPGLTPTPADLAVLTDTLAALMASADWFILSGSLPPGVDPTLYRDLTRRLAGKTVAVDSSGEALRQALGACPAMVKPNLTELEELVGGALHGPAEILAAGRALARDYGIRTVIVSLGKEGAIFIEDDAALWAVPDRVAVLSTVGAGDALLAGVIAGKINGLPLAECARLGTAFAMHALGKLGMGLESIEAVHALRERVDVRDMGTT